MVEIASYNSRGRHDPWADKREYGLRNYTNGLGNRQTRGGILPLINTCSEQSNRSSLRDQSQLPIERLFLDLLGIDFDLGFS